MPRLILFVACLSLPLAVMAGPPRLVRDINTQPEVASSAPANLADQGSWLFLTASHSPWATTDGTAAGTARLAPIAMPAQPYFQPVVRVGSLTYFFQFDIPWVTDGTPAGTLQLHPNLVNVAPLGSVNGLLLFSGGSQRAREVWSTNGTVSGTHHLATIDQGRTDKLRAAIVGNRLYFLASGENGSVEPWVSDGTVVGTHALDEIPLAAAHEGWWSNVAVVGSYVLFTATTVDLGRELWRIDTANNDALELVTDLAPGDLTGVSPTWIGAVGDGALFVAEPDGVQQLWRTDGTAAGTAYVSDFTPSEWDMEWAYEGPTTTGRFFFRIDGNDDSQLWTTDGTTVTQLEPAIVFSSLGIVGANYYYAVTTSTSVELRSTDGTGTKHLTGVQGSPFATYEVAEVPGEPTSIYVRVVHHGDTEETAVRVVKYNLDADTATTLLAYAGKGEDELQPLFSTVRGSLYFNSRNGAVGNELWISDGTPAGTRLLLNLAPETGNAASAPGSFVAYGDRLYFAADDGLNGRELWRSDATSAGTELVIDVHPGPGSSEPRDAFVAGARLLFFARDGVGRGSYRLWTTDGTVAGTQPLAPLVPRALGPPATATSCPFAAASIAPYAYFGAYESASSSWGLWRTDGTAGGTARIRAFASAPCWLTVFDGILYFGADGDGAGIELWRYDPAPLGGASLFKDLLPGTQGSDPAELTVLNGRMLFRATGATNSSQLWQSDGSAAGTSPLVSFAGFSAIRGIERATTHVVFYAGGELWASDGTVAGTTRVANLYIGVAHPVRSSGRVFFASTGSTNKARDEEPWVTDGTPAGTSLLRDLNPLSASQPQEFVDFNGVSVFTAGDGLDYRLWRSDGTAAGTTLVGGNLMINLAPVPPPTRLAVGQTFFYIANEGGYDTEELFAFSNDPPLAFSDAATAESAAAVAIAVLANDRDADGALDPSSVRVFSSPANGTAVVQASGAITYTSNADYTGSDTFSYTVADTQRGVSHPATVQVVVAAPPPATPPPATPPTPAPAPSQPPPSSGGGRGGGGATEWGAVLLLLAALGRRRSRRAAGCHGRY